MPLLLGIEFSGAFPSVSLYSESEVLETISIKERNAHVYYGNLLVQELLDKHKIKVSSLDGISLTNGPGSYTGLRVAHSLAKAFCYVNPIKLYLFPSHEILYNSHLEAIGTQDSQVLIDANKDFVFKREYPNTSSNPIQRVSVSSIQATKAIISNSEAHVMLLEETVDKGLLHFVELTSSLHIHTYRKDNSNYLSSLSEISQAVPAYIFAPNITTRKKPLIA